MNNLSNSLDNRLKALVGEDWSEFVLMINQVTLKDSGEYECQVSGPNHTSISRRLQLNVICKYILMENISNLRLFCTATSTKIDNGPDIYVGSIQGLNLSAGLILVAFLLITSYADKVTR